LWEKLPDIFDDKQKKTKLEEEYKKIIRENRLFDSKFALSYPFT